MDPAAGADAERPRLPALPTLASPLWDLLGFAASLAMSLCLGWSARDLIWSLWLSSLAIGYLCIVLGIAGTVRRGWTSPGAAVGSSVLGVFLFGFFTVHFVGFHFGHSVFLGLFFPLAEVPRGGFPVSVQLYLQVASSYWPWLLTAAIAERGALSQALAPPAPADGKAAIMAFNPLRPYLNVVRMHLLIFFFAGAHILRLDGIWIFLVVFAVYFFPWRLLRRGGGQASPERR